MKRSMITGDFIVRDIYCNYCEDQIVGWTYDKAFKSSEEYKVGKFILECKMLVEVPWEGPIEGWRRPEIRDHEGHDKRYSL